MVEFEILYLKATSSTVGRPRGYHHAMLCLLRLTYVLIISILRIITLTLKIVGFYNDFTNILIENYTLLRPSSMMILSCSRPGSRGQNWGHSGGGWGSRTLIAITAVIMGIFVVVTSQRRWCGCLFWPRRTFCVWGCVCLKRKKEKIVTFCANR